MPTGVYIRTEYHKSCCGFQKGHKSMRKAGFKHSEETRKKIRKTLKEKGIEPKIIFVARGENHPMFGKHHSEGAKRKMSDANRGEKHPFYGKHHSKESKDKMSLGNEDKKRSEETKRNLSETHKGKKHTEECRKNMSIAQGGRKITWGDKISKARKEYLEFHSHNRTGIKHTEEAKGKMKGIHKGEKNSQWKGGIGRFPYPFEFDNQLKEKIRKRDNYKCQLCGVPQMECIAKLSIHHIDYDKENLDEDNLTSLCKGCNSKVNSNREYWTRYFQNKLEKIILTSINTRIN